MGLELTENAKKWLANKGWDPVMGARPLRRTIQREIEDSLSERILFNELRPGQIVVVDCDGDPTDIEHSKLVYRGADKPASVPDAVPAGLGGSTPTEAGPPPGAAAS
jgi:ATP-dependent Clp protease ATP-binding subunit ClpC